MAERSATPKGTPSRNGDNSTAAGTAEGQSAFNSNGKPGSGIFEELKAQHLEVLALFKQKRGNGRSRELVERVSDAWIAHTIIEEEFVLPALAEAGADQEELREAEVYRDIAKLLLADLRQSPEDELASPKLVVLEATLTQLIALEEKTTGAMLAKSKSVDLEASRPLIEARKAELKPGLGSESSTALEPSSLTLMGSRQAKELSTMPSSNTRDRDDNGRFRSDDRGSGSGRGYDDDRRGGSRERDDQGRFASDDRYSSRSSNDDDRRSSRSSRDDDDDRRSSRSRSGNDDRERDDRGRFASDDRGSSRSSRDRDDDGDGRGWHGDPRGHSEASRRGWETRREEGDDDRRSSRSSRDDDDDRRSSRSSRDDDDDRRSSRSRSGSDDRERDDRGRFASDDRGSSRSSRDRDDDNGGRGRGWFGDSQGHSEAARRGRDDDDGRSSRSRSSRDDDDDDRRGGSRERDDRGRFASDDRGSSRSRRDDDDDDRRRSRSRDDDDDDRGRGGWFGDSRGHAEAARRGWEDRR